MAVGQIPKKAKLANLINFRVRVTNTNGSQFIGTLLSFDKFMNLVLSDCEEFRMTKKSITQFNKEKSSQKQQLADEPLIKEEKRKLGLVILRGENIISVVVESAPNPATLRPELRLNKKKGSTSTTAVQKGSIKNMVKNANDNKNKGGLTGPLRTGNAGVSKPAGGFQRGGFRRT